MSGNVAEGLSRLGDISCVVTVRDNKAQGVSPSTPQSRGCPTHNELGAQLPVSALAAGGMLKPGTL